MLKGMTVCYLVRRTFEVKKGTTVLIHAAAGGVGLIASQWANHLGATVIGTVGTKEKAELAKANGCHHTILYREEDFVARVKDITKGALCDVGHLTEQGSGLGLHTDDFDAGDGHGVGIALLFKEEP